MTQAICTEQNEQEWRAHCKRMKAAAETKAQELIADGWKRHDRNRRSEHFTKPGHDPVVIRRQLGNPNWYTRKKDF